MPSIWVLFILFGLALACQPSKYGNSHQILILTNNNSTRYERPYVFDLSLSKLANPEKTLNHELPYDSNFGTQLKFNLNLLKCASPNGGLGTRGSVLIKGKWYPFGYPCSEQQTRPHQMGNVPIEKRIVPTQKKIIPKYRRIIPTLRRIVPTRRSIKRILYFRHRKPQPGKQKTERKHFVGRRRRRSHRNRRGHRNTMLRREFIRHHKKDEHKKDEHKKDEAQKDKKKPFVPTGNSIHQGFASLYQYGRSVIGFQVGFRSLEAIYSERMRKSFYIETKLYVVCSRGYEKPTMSYMGYSLAGNVITYNFRHDSPVGCPIKSDSDGALILGPLFLGFISLSFCFQLVPILLLIVAIIIAIKMILRSRNKAKQRAQSLSIQFNSPPMPQVTIQQPAAVVEEKKEPKPVQQVNAQPIPQPFSVPVVRDIEMPSMVFPPQHFYPQYHPQPNNGFAYPPQ